MESPTESPNTSASDAVATASTPKPTRPSFHPRHVLRPEVLKQLLDMKNAPKSTKLDPGTPETAAAKQVFAIAELCELILLHSSMKDVLRVQRVCRTWRDTIVASPSLQTKLFFKRIPLQREETWHYGFQRRSSGNASDLLVLVGPEKDRLYNAVAEEGTKLFQIRPVIFNPLLLRPTYELHKKMQYVCWRLLWHLNYPNGRYGAEGLTIVPCWPFNFSEASCRAMFLTQPPITKLKHTGKFITNADGLTLGDVWDFLCAQGPSAQWTEALYVQGALVLTKEVKARFEKEMGERLKGVEVGATWWLN